MPAEPYVIPKGYARTALEHADYSTTLLRYIHRYCLEAEGTSGIIRLFITEWNSVLVNGEYITDPDHALYHGDVVSVRDFYGKWHTHDVTWQDIEKSW